MGGRFGIGSDFNVFDEWGNYVGKFTPAGGGLEGCFMMLALFTAGLVIFGIYMLAKLTVLGLAALFRGDFQTAFKRLWIPGLIVVLLISQVAAIRIGHLQRQEQERIVQQEISSAETSPEKSFSITKIGDFSRDVACSDSPGFCQGPYPSYDLSLFSKYEITNNTKLDLQPDNSIDTRCVIKDWQYLPSRYTFRSHQTMTIYCGIGGYGSTEVKFYVMGESWTTLTPIQLP